MRYATTLRATVLALVTYAGIAHAADYPYRTTLTSKSATSGLGATDVELIKRLPGAGADQVLDMLRARFASSQGAVNTRGASEREQERHSHALKGDGWLLQVYADGTYVRYRNYAVLESKQNLARPVAQRLSQQALEERGRRFISEALAEAVPLGAGEVLVPLFTEHEINGSRSATLDAAADVETVTASTVIFGRTIGGISVVGPGSKIAVVFTNDGEAAGFDYDWPRYAMTGQRQGVIAMPQIRQRARGLTTVELDAPGVSVKRVECGYFDAGARRRWRDPSAPIQAACGFHYSQRTLANGPTPTDMLAAYVEAIPAGVVIESDAGWPQAIRLTGGAVSEPEQPPTP
jgi:hypothetical protein